MIKIKNKSEYFHRSLGFMKCFSNILTECDPLEKGMANHFSILALRTHEQYEKAKR